MVFNPTTNKYVGSIPTMRLIYTLLHNTAAFITCAGTNKILPDVEEGPVWGMTRLASLHMGMQCFGAMLFAWAPEHYFALRKWDTAKEASNALRSALFAHSHTILCCALIIDCCWTMGQDGVWNLGAYFGSQKNDVLHECLSGVKPDGFRVRARVHSILKSRTISRSIDYIYAHLLSPDPAVNLTVFFDEDLGRQYIALWPMVHRPLHVRQAPFEHYLTLLIANMNQSFGQITDSIRYDVVIASNDSEGDQMPDLISVTADDGQEDPPEYEGDRMTETQ
ncbi:unnamed protein product [Mycena citricolor]|uniref:Uncharacterized protein n=1 Tax=Mycena citricolor TaxID=2018698 RepID=A0AAD2K0N9_9AGAR|nr:unnamed protein product [Mycena citricolor]